eukprot:2284713-Amphidinium_carterae.1
MSGRCQQMYSLALSSLFPTIRLGRGPCKEHPLSPGQACRHLNEQKTKVGSPNAQGTTTVHRQPPRREERLTNFVQAAVGFAPPHGRDK